MGLTCENSSVAALKIFKSNTSIFDCLVGNFQQDPLLWVHSLGLERRDIEECIVEAINALLNEIGVSNICQPFPWAAVRFVKPLRIEACNLGLDVLGTYQILPKFGRRVCTRESTRDTNDGNIVR